MDREDRGAREEKKEKEYQSLFAKANVPGHRIEGFGRVTFLFNFMNGQTVRTVDSLKTILQLLIL
jgi:hypothetical protein